MHTTVVGNYFQCRSETMSRITKKNASENQFEVCVSRFLPPFPLGLIKTITDPQGFLFFLAFALVLCCIFPLILFLLILKYSSVNKFALSIVPLMYPRGMCLHVASRLNNLRSMKATNPFMSFSRTLFCVYDEVIKIKIIESHSAGSK